MKFRLEGALVLVAIAEEGSFGGAAKVLNKAQSAVSYSIRQLEDSLGVELFDRSGHRAILTPVGVAILDEARTLVAQARRLERLAESFRVGWEARLLVIVDGALATGPILEALTELGDEGIATHIQLRTEYLGGSPRRFSELKADLMLSLVVPSDPLVDIVQLPEMEFVLVASPSHRVATKAQLELVDLQPHLELSVHDSDEATWSRDTNLIPGARVFYVGDFAAKKEGLLRGLGFGWMPIHAVEQDLSQGSLVELPYSKGSRRRFPLVLAHRRDRPLGRAGERLQELLIAALNHSVDCVPSLQ